MLDPASVESTESGSSQILAGRYKLVKQLGRGGRGEVWLAVDEQTGDELAIKRLPAELAGDTAALNDLTREVQKSRNLAHPNIIRIHELVQPEGEPAFVTLEYVDGQDLASFVLQQPGHLFAWGKPAAPHDAIATRSSTRINIRLCIAISSPPTCWWIGRAT